MRWLDAHNHLQDHRLDGCRADIAAQPPAEVMVVAGSGVEDWDEVADLARQHAWVRPAFGVHPWYIKEQPADWLERLNGLLAEFPTAGVGEIGLDRWIEAADVEGQQRFLKPQLQLATEQDRAVTLHCLRAWGIMEEALRKGPRPPRGFLLHSYGGPAEMVPTFVKLGAYFSVSPYFLHQRKAKQWDTFRLVPLERLLIETDAPDMWPPDEVNPHPATDTEGHPINHPANIGWMYEQTANLRGISIEDLQQCVEQNFIRLFGPIYV